MTRYRFLQQTLKQLKKEGKVEKSFRCNQKEAVLEERYQLAIAEENARRGYKWEDMDVLDDRTDEQKDQWQAFLESVANPTSMVF